MAFILPAPNSKSLSVIRRQHQFSYVERWLLRDNFTTPLAAGNVNGTAAEPGPGVRTVVDIASKLSLSSGELVMLTNGGAFLEPSISYGPQTRSPGLALTAYVKNGGVTATGPLGWSSATPPTSGAQIINGFRIDVTTSIAIYEGSTKAKIAVIADEQYYTWANVLRATGAMYFIKNGGAWELLWVSESGSTATLYPTLSTHIGTTYGKKFRVAQLSWLPSPLTSDGFGTAGALATTDGLGHAEGVTGGIGSGGGGKTWTSQLGTWANAAGVTAAATLDTGVAAATTPSSTADVLVTASITRAAGAKGIILRWTDANNYLYAEHDGTNCYLKQVLAGSTSTLLTAAAAYSAGAELRAIVGGVNGRLYYNNALIGAVATINAGLTGTAHGVRTTDTSNSLDNFNVYARGTGGEYDAPLNEVANG